MPAGDAVRSQGRGKVAVCTLPLGAVGETLVEGLARRGWDVGCVSHNGGAAAAAHRPERAGVRAYEANCAFDSTAAVSEALHAVQSALDTPRLLVHGFPAEHADPPRPLVELDEADWVRSCEATMSAALFTLQAYRGLLAPPTTSVPSGPAAASSNHAVVVLLTPLGALHGLPGQAALAAAGEGIRALGVSAARQWGPAGVRVHSVAVADHELLGEGAVAQRRQGLAVPSLPDSDPIAALGGLVDWLTSDDADALNGQTFVLDKGTWMVR